jgi:tetratricopeptide (TPR) repeat protein
LPFSHRVFRITALALPIFSWGHPAIEAQIALINERLEQSPADGALYFKRAQLHRQHREWDSALRDFDQALRLDPLMTVAQLRRGEVFLEADRAGEAKQAFDEFLKAHPTNLDGLLLRERALQKLGDSEAAAADYSQAIDRSSRPQPDWYIERARALAAAGLSDAAVSGLDEGIARLGPLVTLHSLALDIELRERRRDAALARVERLLGFFPSQEQWLIKRGEILAEASRGTEARDSIHAGLKAIDSLPPNRRRAKAALELEAQARELLVKIAAAQ